MGPVMPQKTGYNNSQVYYRSVLLPRDFSLLPPQMLSVTRRLVKCSFRVTECARASLLFRCPTTGTLVESPSPSPFASLLFRRFASATVEPSKESDGSNILTPNQLKRLHRKKTGGLASALEASVPGKVRASSSIHFYLEKNERSPFSDHLYIPSFLYYVIILNS